MLEKIDQIMKELIFSFGYDKASEMFQSISSGKKLRSKLILKIAPLSDESLKLCAIVELIHSASLLHDDVIDESSTRRGKASVNATYGSKNAIMLGDILYSKGYYELTKFDSFICREISKAVSLLSIGELMDVELSKSFNTNKDKYINMIYNKTAVLIEASAKCGAFLAGLDTDKFAQYGKNLGLAFQIIDDVLDITQSSDTLGKPSLSDFKDGKTTLPYIYLYENLDENDKEILKSYFAKELDDSQISWIKSKFNEHNIVQKTINEAKNLAKEGILAIDEYKNDGLVAVMKNMVDREF
ncbi:polyprenyl synthetase family protein [Campylobacter corcagiensis]|uniref:Polyprenyl synthetase family protein n=1 Tax=Campylobacter corcagiensis TaxID=1448857 RepID=A0A7M1LFI4_9BACT|nr:polyprenyl synthetase family protein [Campylobacter corcagiensis]QKF64482.1 octaprenyl-diphosphate synthase [Campylobacter corcagiensis]QOQ87337.1 polyprenyl synthetase family protein [Campylobacter corcagiensis]